MRFVWLLLTMALVNCLDELPKYHAIESLRVLGVSASPPEVAAGETTQLSVLAVHPDDADIEYQWYACLITERGTNAFGGSQAAGVSGGKGYGVDDPGDCKVQYDNGAPFAQDLGQAATAELKVPDGLLSFENVAAVYGFPENAKEIMPLVLEVAGLNYTVQVTATRGDEEITALKRVNVSIAKVKNENPSGVAFFIGPEDTDQEPPTTGDVPTDGSCFFNGADGPLEVTLGDNAITAVNVPDPPVEYSVLVGDFKVLGSLPKDREPSPEQLEEILTKLIPTHTESLFYSVFSTHGKFSRDIFKSTGTRQVIWTLKKGDVADSIPIWIVTRDGRGGTTWCRSEVTLAK